MTKDKLMEGNCLINEIKECEFNVKNLEKMRANRQIYVRGRDDAGAILETVVPNQIRNAIVTLLSDYYRQRLAEAEEEFKRL